MGQMLPMLPMQLMQPMLLMQQIRQMQYIQQMQQFQQFQQVHHFPQFASFGPTNNIPFWHQGTYTNIYPSVQTSSKKATAAKPKYVPLPGVIEELEGIIAAQIRIQPNPTDPSAPQPDPKICLTISSTQSRASSSSPETAGGS